MQPTEKLAHRVADKTPVGPDPRVGARIARSRREAGLSQRALADCIGVRLWMVDQWETGARAVSEEQLARVADATSRPAQWFLTGADERLAEHPVEPPVFAGADAALETAELEHLARGVAEREQALVEREAELEARAKKIDETQLHADERLAELERRERELSKRRRELEEERDRILEAVQQERSQADEAIVGKALIRAQRVADLLQAEAVQEAETTVAAARIEANAIVARVEHARELVNRDRAQVNEVLTQLRVVLEEAVLNLDSVAPSAADGNGQVSAQNHGGVGPAAQTHELANGREADALDGDLHLRVGGGQSDGEATVA